MPLYEAILRRTLTKTIRTLLVADNRTKAHELAMSHAAVPSAIDEELFTATTIEANEPLELVALFRSFDPSKGEPQ